MKKRILIVTVGVILIFVTCFFQGIITQRQLWDWYLGRNVEKHVYDAVLYVEGKEITDENVCIWWEERCFPYGPPIVKHADLPFTKVMESFGAEIEWRNDKIADITYNNKKYILDLNEVTLTESGDDLDLIPPICGGRTTHRAIYKELILDDNTLSWLLADLNNGKSYLERGYQDKKIYFEIDFEKCIIHLHE